jgi:hypothetical protein
MFNIGELVMNRKTGQIGTVCSYGHQIIDSVYFSTLIVQVRENTGTKRSSFVEDLSSEWIQKSNTETPVLSS